MAAKKAAKKTVARKSVDKSVDKSSKTPPRPFRPGPDPRRGRGPKKGAPKAGRPPDEFKQMLAALASWSRTLGAVEAILADPNHPHFMRALDYVSERGYGKVAQGMEVSAPGGGPVEVLVTRRIVRPEDAE